MDNPASAMIYGGLMGTTSGVAGGLAATDEKLVPYGAMTATFYTGAGCLLAPSVYFSLCKPFWVKACENGVSVSRAHQPSTKSRCHHQDSPLHKRRHGPGIRQIKSSNRSPNHPAPQQPANCTLALEPDPINRSVSLVPERINTSVPRSSNSAAKSSASTVNGKLRWTALGLPVAAGSQIQEK
ncbi:MAG: hypothetical protein AB8B96_05085 [Lysobacterales bacterium]